MSTSALEINGKNLQPIKDAAESVSYSRDYITRLAREGKIVASNIGRQWFVDIDSLQHYEKISQLEKELRKKQLSEERKLEKKSQTAKSDFVKSAEAKADTFKTRAAVTAVLALSVGLLGGFTTYQNLFKTNSSSLQVASTAEVKNTDQQKIDRAGVTLIDESDKRVNQDNATPPSQSLKKIGSDVESGVLLLPQGSIHASASEMFSDEVKVLTSEDGVQMVVRVDEQGAPVGEVIPFVTVPVVNEDDNR